MRYDIARIEAHTVRDVYLANGERFRRDETGRWSLLFYDEWLEFSGAMANQLEVDYQNFSQGVEA